MRSQHLMMQVISMDQIVRQYISILKYLYFNLVKLENMNHKRTFETFLKDGIGLSSKEQRTAIITHGFDTCQGLLDTTNEGIKEVFNAINLENRNAAAKDKVIIREQIKQRFYGARAELMMRTECGADLSTALLTAIDTDDMDDFVRKHNSWKEYKKAASNMSLPSVTVPKLTKNNWKLYSQAIRELLTRQRGTHNIPLIYVIRQTTSNYDDRFSSTEEQLIKCIKLSGGKFRSDNSSVWSLLSEHAVGTEAESIVNRYQSIRDGRAAWNALLAHMQSTSYVDNLKSHAMHKLTTSAYNGEKKNFGIVKYYQIHSEAHNDLASAGEPLTDGMKITHFLQGMRDDTAMNFAITTKSEAAVNTFEEFYNSFSAKLSTKLTLTQPNQTSHRHINQLNSSNSNGNRQGNGNGSRGGGRGSRRGGRDNNRGGRGNGRGRGGRFGNRNRHNPIGGRGWRPQAREYSSEEWSQLSYEQRQRIFDLRNHIRDNESGGSRRVSQVTQDDNTIPSQVGLPPPPDHTQQPTPPPNEQDSITGQSGRAGDAFSSGTGRR